MFVGIGIPLTRQSGDMLAAAVASLFAAGEQGVWYDPSDLSSMYQDSAGTTAAVVGQPVGKILDKSGRGNHATQATSASRPTLQQDGSGFYYLSFDGFDDGMVTGSIDFSATDKMTVWAGVNKQSDAAQGSIVHFSGADICEVGFPRSGVITGPYLSIGGCEKRGVNAAAPLSAVVTGLMDRAGLTVADQVILRVNGAVVGADSGAVSGSGNFGSRTAYIGRRTGTTIPLNGRIYSLIFRGAATAAAQIVSTEAYVTGKTGS